MSIKLLRYDRYNFISLAHIRKQMCQLNKTKRFRIVVVRNDEYLIVVIGVSY